MFHNKTLRTKLVISLLAVSLIPLITAGYLTYSYTRVVIKAREIKKINEISENKAKQITAYIDEEINDVQALTKFLESQQIFLPLLSKEKKSTPVSFRADNKLIKILKTYESIYDFDNITFISTKGKILYSVKYSKGKGLNLTADKSNKSELFEVFKKAVAQQTLEVSKVQYFPLRKKYAEYIFAPIVQKGTVKYTLAIALNIRRLSTIINDSTGLGKTGQTIFSGRQNQETIFITTPKNFPDTDTLCRVKIVSKAGRRPIQLAAAGGNGMGALVDHRGKQVIASWKYIPILDSGIVVKMNQSEVFATLSLVTKWMIFVILLIAVLVIVAIFFISKSITKPIGNLTYASKSIAEGDFTTPINIKGTREIKILAETFSKMQQNLKTVISLRDKEIIERKQTEKLLLESETKFKTLFEQSSYAVLLMKGNFFIDCNLNALEMFKCSKKELLNSTSIDISPTQQPDGQLSEELAMQYINAALNSEPQAFEWQHKRFNGALFYTEVNLKAIELPKDKIILVQVKDITEKKFKEAEIKKLSLAVEQAAVSILITDINGNIEFVNKKYEEVSGYSLEELYMRKTSIFKSGLTDKKIYKGLWETISSVNPWKGELLNRKKNGELFWESCNITPLTDENGKIIHYFAVKEDITKHKKNETELLESEAKFRNVTETAPYAIITTDKYGKIITWNYAAQKMFGYTKKYVMNMSVLKIIPEKFREEYKKAINNEKYLTKLNLIDKTFESLGLTSEGREFPMELSLSKWKVNNETFYTVHIKDITQRKLNEKALKESEEKYKTFFINDLAADVLATADGKILDYNHAFLKMFAFEPSDILNGVTALSLYADKNQRKNLLSLLKKKKKLISHEIRLKKKHGEIIDVIENVLGVFDENGELKSIIAYMMDVTEKKQNEKEIFKYQEHLEDIVEERTRELELSEEKFKALAENSDDAIMRFDHNLKHIYVNPAVAEHTGIPHENFLGKTHEELGFPKNLCSMWEEVIEKVFNTKSKNRIEFQLPNKHWIDWALLPEFDAQGNVNAVITFGRDITERKRSEKIIADSLTKEKELNKLKSLFLSSVSHEFKTPLTTILSSVGLLETFRERGNMKKYSIHISKIKNSVKYLSTMIEEILTLQKEEDKQISFAPGKNNLYQLAKSIFVEMTEAAQNNHSCKLNYNIDKGRLFWVDKKLITLILSNLISNAIKYSPNGGNVAVNIIEENKNLIFKVSDEGIGIAEKDKDNIFIQFYRGLNRNNNNLIGTGLGLSIVKKSVELHGGSIKFDSKINKGTTFIVTIPVEKFY